MADIAGRSLILLGVAALFLVASCVRAQDDGPDETAEDGPRITIRLDSYDIEIDTRPGQSGVVWINGTVECLIPPIESDSETCTISFFVDSGTWPSHGPADLTFTKERSTRHLNFTVMAPYGIPAGVTHQVRILGGWGYSERLDGGFIEPVLVNITSREFIDVQLSPGIIYARAEKGEWAELSVDVRNFGNSDVNVTLTVVKGSDDIEVEPMAVTILVAEQDSYLQTFRVRNTEKWVDNEVIIVNGTLSEGEPYWKMSIELRLSTEPDPGAYVRTLVTVASIAGLMLIGLVVFVIVVGAYRRSQERSPEE